MWILDSLKGQKYSQVLAIVTRSGNYTFEQVWAYSEFIAHDIEATGKNTPVVIYGDKNPNIIPTLMAALKTGRAYVPVDISFPIERLNLIAQTVDACVIYNYSGKELNLPFLVRDESYVQDVLYSRKPQDDIPQSHWVKDEDDCYILFTSGSTGNPKGVPITKANLLNFINDDFYIPKNIGQNVLCQVSFSFDVSGQMIYLYMGLGKTLICIDKGLLEDSFALVEWMANNQISLWVSTPSFVDLCRKCSIFNGKTLAQLKTFYLGGEVLNKSTIKFIREAFPDATVCNVYGPTEATIWISGCIVTDEMIEADSSIPIGKLMREADYYLESQNGKPVNGKQNPGELVLISKSVGHGYYKNPEKTAEVFFKSKDGRMAYRTGDLVYEKNGLLYFVSRKDFQIKLNGYRVELDDISRNLDKLPPVKGNIIIPAYNEDGKIEYLAGFVTLNNDWKGKTPLQNIIAIKKGLSALVPSYMVPRKIVILEDFPLNVNGKIDRKVLAKML